MRTDPLARPASKGRTLATTFRTVGLMRSGLFIPVFDELADPAIVARLSAEAEEAGWHGVFLWDHVRLREPVADVADAWITLTAIAVATEAIRLGPMVTPLARRRPVKVARETATLDRLSDGRLTLGVGLGSDHFESEFSITGEDLDARRRAQMLDESPRDPGRRLVGSARAPSGRALHGRGHAVPAAARSAAGCAGVGRGVLRKGQAAAPGSAARGLLPRQPRKPGAAR
jgi:hypothetical protein